MQLLRYLWWYNPDFETTRHIKEALTQDLIMYFCQILKEVHSNCIVDLLGFAHASHIQTVWLPRSTCRKSSEQSGEFVSALFLACKIGTVPRRRHLLPDAAVEPRKCWLIQYKHCTAKLDPEDQYKQRSPRARSVVELSQEYQSRLPGLVMMCNIQRRVLCTY